MSEMKLKIFHWIDGPPGMNLDLGWNWQLEDEAGKVRAECHNGFKTLDDARADALLLCLDWPNVEFVELGKFNPDEPHEYVNGHYAGSAQP